MGGSHVEFVVILEQQRPSARIELGRTGRGLNHFTLLFDGRSIGGLAFLDCESDVE
jgi:hypothetical protein